MRALLAASAAIAALSLAACGDDADVTVEADAPAEMTDDSMDDGALADGEDMDVADADTDAADMVAEDDGGMDTAQLYAMPSDTPDNIRRAVESAERSPEMVERDAGRHPAEMLMMASVDEGDHVIEFAGFGQYYTTMLAEAVGPDGQVDVYDLPYTDRFAGEPSRAFDAAHDNVAYHQGEYDEMTLPSDVDEALIVLYYHDLHVSTNTVDIPGFNQKIYDALKPGGTYFIIDHNAPAGTGTSTTDDMHRIDPQVIRDEVTAAGFELVEETDMLSNPDDDYSLGPFDPGIRGMTDRSVFVFRKPG